MELRKLALATLCASSALALPAFANSDAVEPVGKIFLTFDDGPMNATPALIDLLDSMGVKATFYINGWHLDGIGDENEDHALAALQQTLNSGHVIGNHSYDHMIHNCVDEFGPNSAAECNETQGWSIHSYQDPATDVLGFAENMEVVGEYLGDVSQYPNYQMSSLARLPYTNSWRVTHDFQADAPCATSDGVQRECSLEDPYISSKNAIEVSNLLAEQGYQIHGWDLDMWISSPVAFAPEEIEQIAFKTIDTLVKEELRR